MARFLTGIFLALVVLVLEGCGGGPDLTGTWGSGLGGAVTTYHFRKDGTFMMENIYAGTRAVVEGKYSTAGGKLSLNPEKSNVEGVEPEASNIKSVIMQPSRVTLTQKGPNVYQIGLQEPPLVMTRMSKDPEFAIPK